MFYGQGSDYFVHLFILHINSWSLRIDKYVIYYYIKPNITLLLTRLLINFGYIFQRFEFKSKAFSF